MDLKEFLSVSGYPGLYKFISEGKNLLIVENLENGQKMPVHTTNRISSLEEIAVFTYSEDKPLKDILFLIHQKENGKPLPDPKTLGNDKLKALFEEILPDYDKEKVYVSDIKKLFLWYNILVNWGKLEWVETPPETLQPAENQGESPDQND